VIIFTSELMDGEEIEIRPAGHPWDGTHTAIRPRDLRDSVAFAGVFGSLQAGTYQVRVKGSDAGQESVDTLDLTVHGGEITQLSWPP
jgi:methyl coenzyme M reductase gamma subunit